MKYNCIIVDDEPLAIKLIKRHLEHFPDFNIIAECENAIEASSIMLNNDIDLIFLDIQMPEINGIEFLRSLIKKPKVIITSAYKEYAIDGFELDVLDFLLKPITLDRFFKAINKFTESIKKNKNLNSIAPNREKNINDIYIKDTNKTYRVNPDDIIYIEGMREYIKVYTASENIVTKCSLTNFMEKLPENIFIRTHKSFIVNSKKVSAFTVSNVEINNKKIPIGRSYKINTINFLKNNDS